jgi:hypothetical protein
VESRSVSQTLEVKRRHGQVTRAPRHHAKQPCVHVMRYKIYLNIRHKTNHFALRAKLYLKATRQAYAELKILRAA